MARERKTKTEEDSSNHIKDFEKEFLALYSKYMIHFKDETRIALHEVLKGFQKKVDDFVDTYQVNLFKRLDSSLKEMKKFCKRIESLEEAFFILYGNIKRNHFLYVNHPKEWWDQHHPIIKKELNKQDTEVKQIIEALYKIEKNNEEVS